MKEVFFSSLVLFRLILAEENFKLNSYPLADEYVDYPNHQNLSWKAKRYLDQDSRDFQYRFGVLPVYKIKTRSLLYRTRQSDESIDVPEFFDAREKWSRCKSIRMIRDQSVCGACWAFAAVSAMSDRICIHSGQTEQTLISAENLIGCCKRCANGCEGGYPNSAWAYWYTNGIVTGGEHKHLDQGCQSYSVEPCYSGKHQHRKSFTDGGCDKKKPIPPICRQECDNGTSLVYEESLVFGQKPYALPNIERDIQLEIMTNGPVQATFDVYEEFLNYEKGVYQKSNNSGEFLSQHSVKLIGWGVDKDSGDPYWLGANSWGKIWGQNGFFKILRGVNHCGIEDVILAGLPRKDPSMEKLENVSENIKTNACIVFSFITILFYLHFDNQSFVINI